MDHRETLQQLFRAALERVGGRPAVRHALEDDPPAGAVHLLAIGKAASAMTQGALDALDDRIASGLVVTKTDHLGRAVAEDPRFRCMETAHPIPDGSSLAAGAAVVAFLDELPDDAELVVLISGGASSLVELLPEGLTADHLAELNQWLLGQHLAIDGINAVRRAISRIKGGRLARHLRGRRTRLLLISDVPGDDPAVIGSGLFVPSAGSGTLPGDLPAWAREAAKAVPAPPAADDPALAGLTRSLVATNADALDAVEERGRRLGLSVQVHREQLAGDALRAGEAIADQLVHGAAGIHVWGGEPTVALPDNPGQGGRAQALALTAAACMEGHRGVWLLAAGTDGTDGPGNAAGALVDHQTCFRGRQAGLDPDVSLEAADSGRFLEASGDLLRTGPTGTNVMDVVIGLKDSGEGR
ncbi:DUF4147 domain-containing protein [Aquisalimonas sp.]|uniref:glycerate kinase type-2 family protein n=1 Tax=Aquisalimonas sp. TaxID=1872621 RepID=UPI0025BDF07A|nr:DUF4147 domain-containing protein [Aquisalimonas sp.]